MTGKRRILVLYAHPNPAQSRVQQHLLQAIQDVEGVEIRDLYRLYPHFYVDAKVEQEAAARADLIIFQHPLYWYSCPALLKEWQDSVFEQGFAYGPNAVALRGKDFLQVISLGALQSSYQRQGGNRFTLNELLRPFEATAWLCGLTYHQPFIIQGGTRHRAMHAQQCAQDYRELLMQYQQEGRNALRGLNSAEDSRHDG